MKIGIVALALVLAPVAAHAVDYRWTSGFGQGTTEALIRNGEGASFNIYCPAGSTDTTPGLIVETRKISLRTGAPVDLQIVVDGRNLAFTLQEGQARADARGTRLGLNALARALASSKAKTFTVEFPAQRKAERFSLLNARDALMEGKASILEPCL